jgi:hypothetical protein
MPGAPPSHAYREIRHGHYARRRALTPDSLDRLNPGSTDWWTPAGAGPGEADLKQSAGNAHDIAGGLQLSRVGRLRIVRG